MKRLRYIMLLAGLMSLSLQTIYAQRITRSFRNTSMSEAQIGRASCRERVCLYV